MARTTLAGSAGPVQLTGVDFPIARGQQRITLAGASVVCTLPARTNRFILAAEGGDVRFRFNGPASATSAGYVPENGIVDIVVGNMNALFVYGAAASFANLLYFQQP